VIALAVEVQLSKEGDLYGIVVICETRALARKFAMPVMLGVGSSAITPKAIGPREIPVITSLQDGMADPGRLMLSAWYHSRRGPEPRESLVRLLVQVVEPLYDFDHGKAQHYYDLATVILNPLAVRRLKDMTPQELTLVAAERMYPEVVRKYKRVRRISSHCSKSAGSVSLTVSGSRSSAAMI
jgi:hypothetical protein